MMRPHKERPSHGDRKPEERMERHLEKKRQPFIGELLAEAARPTIHRSPHVMQRERRSARRMAISTLNDEILRMNARSSLPKKMNRIIRDRKPGTTKTGLRNQVRKLGDVEVKRFEKLLLLKGFSSPYHRCFFLIELREALREQIRDQEASISASQRDGNLDAEIGFRGFRDIFSRMRSLVDRSLRQQRKAMGEKDWMRFERRSKWVGSGAKSAENFIDFLGKRMGKAVEQARSPGLRDLQPGRAGRSSRFNKDLFNREKEKIIGSMLELFEKRYPEGKIGTRKTRELSIIIDEAEASLAEAKADIKRKEQELEQYQRDRRFNQIREDAFFKERDRLEFDINNLGGQTDAIKVLINTVYQRLKK